jgi:hypothetical protein
VHQWVDGGFCGICHERELTIGSLVRTLNGELDSDEDDNERRTPAGTVGRVTRISKSEYETDYDVVFPNGAWVIYEECELGKNFEPVEHEPREAALVRR